jgi:hypothetical protein
MSTIPIEEKPDLLHGEHLTQVLTNDNVLAQKRQAIEDGHDIQLKSAFDNLGLLKTVKVFRKTALICLVAAFVAGTDGESLFLRIYYVSADAEGYQNQMVSSIVANAGFKKQFGTYNAAKKSYVLEPLAVSTFGGLFSCGQVLGQFSTQWLSDWVGRKKAMYATMLVLLVVGVFDPRGLEILTTLGCHLGSYCSSLAGLHSSQADRRYRNWGCSSHSARRM